MTGQLRVHRLRSVASVALLSALAVLYCARPDAASPPGQMVHTDSIAAASVETDAELYLPSLIYDPPAPVSPKPILRALVDNGYRADADLKVSMRPIALSAERFGPVRLYEVMFQSHRWHNADVRIFGYYGHPDREQVQFPALLLVHGGGGYATIGRVLEAVGRGYAALSIDLPGGGLQREGKSRSTGPDMTVEQLFTVKPRLEDNYIYSAVRAQMRSITFLCRRPEVDPVRIGLVGVSWGGATGLITTSLDKRIKCFVDLYGSGYLRGGSTWDKHLRSMPPDDLEVWERNFDPCSYVANITVPVLGVTGTNDNCYYLNRFLRTLQAIRPTPELIIRPNLDHKIDEVARIGYFKWLGAQLRRDTDAVSAALGGWRCVAAEGEGVEVSVRARGPLPVSRAEVWYAVPGGVGWTDRHWAGAPCAPDASGTWWTSTVPARTQPMFVYASLHFGDGSTLSTPVHSVARVEVDGLGCAADAPFTYRGPVLIEATRFARIADATLAVDPSSSRVTLTRLGATTSMDAIALGEMRFINLRQAVQQLSGTVKWHREENSTFISLPTELSGQSQDAREAASGAPSDLTGGQR